MDASVTFIRSRLSETSSSENIKETASVMIGGINNVVNAARYQAVKDAPEVNSHSSLVSLPVFGLVEEPESSPYDLVDGEEEYLSPEERVEKRKREKTLKLENHHKKTNQVSDVSSEIFAYNLVEVKTTMLINLSQNRRLRKLKFLIKYFGVTPTCGLTVV